MSIIDPVVSDRVRAILGRRGGPLIEAEDTVLPVALVAGWPVLRQPNLESGALIGRRFFGSVEEVVAGAGSHARIGIRSGDVNAMLWLRKMWLYSRDAGGMVEGKWGRADTWAFGGAPQAAYQDHRLPDSSLVPSPVDLGAGEFAAGANATFHGFIQHLICGGTTASASGPQPVELDEVLVTDGVDPDTFTVELVTADRDLIVAFEGYVFDIGR